MIEFFQTPLGIWIGLIALSGMGIIAGMILSLVSSFWGQQLTYCSFAIGFWVSLFGVLPVLYLAGFFSATFLVLAAIACAGTIALILGMMLES